MLVNFLNITEAAQNNEWLFYIGGVMMGRMIERDDNGKYKVYSTIADGYIMRNVTPEQIIESYVDEYRDDVTNKVMRQIERLGE
ncbi:hypothetical protein [Paenibacillus sp. FSL W8-1287]|uniref:hypothetical protein n=1 Tax=Paenibacillus sp. FSL W8-1287 TaxID=2954653 RepID=UPI0030CE09CC